MMEPQEHYPRLASLADAHSLRARLDVLGILLPADDAVLPVAVSPLAQTLPLMTNRGPRTVGNRFVIQPMEGWDGTADGLPSELTSRRWRRFGASGAAWMWGGEAVAVCAAGRANPSQLLLSEATAGAIGQLRRDLLANADPAAPPLLGLQLTHSGRWSRPTSAGPQPRVAFRHPLLDQRVGIDTDTAVLSDAEVETLIGQFARAAYLAQEEGFEFVDVKHCHGYLLHEFLAARTRGGRYGGETLESRTRLLCEVVAAVRAAAPRLDVAVRLSAFDCVPHQARDVASGGGVGVPMHAATPYWWAFGLDPRQPQRIDLSEPIAVVRLLHQLGVRWLNVTGGSPYYVPHVQRPALFPPSDGYAPPEDPLVGVARLLAAARAIKAAVPEMVVVSSGWTYLQEFIPHVAQACLRDGWFDAVGLGRLALSYPDLPRAVFGDGELDRRRLCRTFSDCTTAPRNGMVSGCYPLDSFYRQRPERLRLEALKRAKR